MSFTYMMYFSTELNGKGYKIGQQNFEKFVEIMFDGLNVTEAKIDDSGKIFTVTSEKRLTQEELNRKRDQCMFRFKSGTLVNVFVMAEMS